MSDCWSGFDRLWNFLSTQVVFRVLDLWSWFLHLCCQWLPELVAETSGRRRNLQNQCHVIVAFFPTLPQQFWAFIKPKSWPLTWVNTLVLVHRCQIWCGEKSNQQQPAALSFAVFRFLLTFQGFGSVNSSDQFDQDVQPSGGLESSNPFIDVHERILSKLQKVEDWFRRTISNMSRKVSRRFFCRVHETPCWNHAMICGTRLLPTHSFDHDETG